MTSTREDKKAIPAEVLIETRGEDKSVYGSDPETERDVVDTQREVPNTEKDLSRTKAYKSVGDYFKLGPTAVASHLDELNEASEIQGKSSGNQVIIRDCLRSIGLGKVTPKVRGLLRILARRTIAEINKERAAFQSILGGNLRTWEIKKSPTCPQGM